MVQRRDMQALVPAAVFAALMLAPLEARASGAGEDGNCRIKVSWAEDLTVTALLLAEYGLLYGFQDGIVGTRCGWCRGPDALDRGVRSGLLAPDTGAASLASSLVLGGIGLLALVSEIVVVKRGGESWTVFFQDLTLMVEALVYTGLVTQVFKMGLRRPRPAMHYEQDEEKREGHGSEELMGFFSGHASFASSLVASTATLMFLRNRRIAPWIAGAGAALALAVGLLRISADKHYLSDVLAGLIAGTAAGAAVPLLHSLPCGKKRKGTGGSACSLAITPGPGIVSIAGRF
ncbi:MAG: phosphatase PAP2 family protein [Pseudomonadota bacterium]